MAASEVLLLIGMFVVTFTVRWFMLGFARSIVFPAWFKAALTFVPVAILTAIVVPMMLLPKGVWWLSWQNPYLFAGLIAAWVAWRWQHLLLTLVTGLIAFALLSYLFA